MTKRTTKRTVATSSCVLRTRTFTPAVVDDLQTNSTIPASTPGHEAADVETADVELDGEDSVTLFTAAAEDLLRNVSPLTRASVPSPVYSVDDILISQMMRDPRRRPPRCSCAPGTARRPNLCIAIVF